MNTLHLLWFLIRPVVCCAVLYSADTLLAMAGQPIESAVDISADFDGKRRVWAPVGGFFGSGPGLNPFRGWWRQVEQDGWMTCWWPMPFKESAVVSIANHGTSEIAAELVRMKSERQMLQAGVRRELLQKLFEQEQQIAGGLFCPGVDRRSETPIIRPGNQLHAGMVGPHRSLC